VSAFHVRRGVEQALCFLAGWLAGWLGYFLFCLIITRLAGWLTGWRRAPQRTYRKLQYKSLFVQSRACASSSGGHTFSRLQMYVYTYRCNLQTGVLDLSLVSQGAHLI